MSEADSARLRNNKILIDYIAYFEKLTPRRLRLIEKLAEPGMRFKDPFNDVRGTDAVERIFEHMFATTQNPKFRVKDYAWTKDNMGAFIRWDFSYQRGGKGYTISGVSEIAFSQRGYVDSHIDYWDSGEYFYAHLPIIGRIWAWVKNKMRV